ncbi:MAG TPA: MopE-related protein, partial [Sandaracinaceae bacterium]
DEDGDGYGEGCALGPDCDDSARNVSPAASETCNGIDDDCDGTTDEDVGAPSCRLTEGVCAGATARCSAEGGFLECDATDYGPDYEADETLCDGLDNDCDGTTDEGCPCTDGATQVCGSDVGACTQGTQTCVGDAWGPCEGAVGPMGESCNGVDDDCDGSVDEPTDLTPPDCELQLGVCAGAKRTCGGAAGWLSCSGTESYGSDYELEETRCDGLDNDCDGVVDENCECVDGATQPCGSDVGECVAGVQTCVAGSWGACAGEVTARPEECNGLDDDCDGRVDEGVVGAACPLQEGVCAGSSQSCGGAGGFVECGPANYGPHYQETETACDGRDNDCDGVIDEGCTCVDGTTQPCGIATGRCELGVQTCSGGEWGACEGGVGPAPEECNGVDDDCDGATDDDLTPPLCPLQLGVCAGARQTCGGASGWQPCTAATYGPHYVATEDGAADETHCDGLDNDCDGLVDEGCISGPLAAGPADQVFPDVYHRSLAYSELIDGNYEIVFANLDRGGLIRLTNTPENEYGVRISGNQLVFLRGTGPSARAVLYDLATHTETVLSTRETGWVHISGRFVAWDERNGSQWDVVVYDIATDTATVLGTSTTDEFAPVVRDGRVAFIGTSTGRLLVHVAEYDVTTGTWSPPVVQSGTSPGHGLVVMDFVGLAWADARAITGTPTETSDWDIYGAALYPGGSVPVFPGETPVDTRLGAQIVRDMDSQLIIFDDHDGTSWDIGITSLGLGTSVFATSSAANQSYGAVSGTLLVWHDNRLGNYDVYGTVIDAAIDPAPGYLQIVEVLADPAPGADPNGDGTPNTSQDEYVEIMNLTGAAIDLSGLVLRDAVGDRHVFPSGTVVPAGGFVVVFGGGAPTGNFAGATVHVASTGQLGLNNEGDTLTLTTASGTVIDTVSYGSEGGMDQAIVRDGTTWQLHGSLVGSVGAYSPGTWFDGFVP